MTTDDSFIREERRHELQMAEIKANEQRIRRREINEQIGWVLWALSAVLIVGIISVLIWRLVLNSSAQNTQRDKDCIAEGGTRVPLSGGPVVCLQLAPVEEQ